MLIPGTRMIRSLLLALGAATLALEVAAAVLPEDRADVLYHSYDGGGAEISGPSLLVRKKFNESLSASVNHYVDNVSSASIDVVTTASPYTEKRTQNSLSVDYLHEKTLMSVGITNSSENDYDATTFSLNMSQDMFGDLTTVNMGFALGDNTVMRRNDDDFEEPMKTRNYRLSVSQIMNKELIMVFSLETVTDEGFLNNPYRQVRFLDSDAALGYSFQAEEYPNTRTSNAFAVRARYFLPYRAALHGGLRYFSDTWGIEANTFELGYTWPFRDDWLLELSYRLYDQTRADFYNDLFPFGGDDNTAQNFLARDKELSTFTSQTFGVGGSWEFTKNGAGFVKRASLNLNYDYIMFDYDDFRDITVITTPGEEPLYSYNASVIRLFLSVWF